MGPPKKGAPKANEDKKPATKAAAPKLTARRTATKASPADNDTPAKQTTKQTPSKKAQKAEATAKAAASSATKAPTAPLDRPTLPGETPPSQRAKRQATTAKAKGTPAPPKAPTAPLDRPTLPGEEPPSQRAKRNEAAATATGTAAPKATKAPPVRPKQPAETPQQRANTSRKRRSSSIDEEEEEEVEPVATRTASKKIKTGSSNSKRKATADANKRPLKVAKVEQDEQEYDPVDSANPRRKPAAKKAANSKAKTPASRATGTANATGRKPAASKVEKVGKVKKAPAAKLQTGVQINFAPTQPLDIFVFGSGESGELGLGNKKIDGKKPVNVKRPRIHPFLSAEAVGVVQIACGGMHSVALTKDNKILTWGVNDQGALGRNTAWDGGLRDADAEDDDDDGDDFEALNPIECTPAEVSTKNIVNGTKFVKVVASDSASFALTEDGRLYGWGTFRSSDGILGFTKDTLVQYEPVFLPDCKKIVDIAVGNNHVMTLDNKGKVETWGAPEMNQLGRRVVQRDMKASALRPGGLSFKRGIKIVKIACGSYHSFAIDDLGRLYAWGLNNYGELGLDENVGEDAAAVLEPTLIESLTDYGIAEVAGGEHHSIACTEDGKLLVWGRIDGKQTGLTADKFNNDNAIYDDHEKPRILTVPTVHEGFPSVVSVACGTDNSFAITQDGKAYSWGFSANYQTGQGEQDDDVEVPTLIDNSAVHDRKILSAGAGGQFSVLTSIHQNA
ncbi:hypothetical protein INS49_010046 [Diaporthe citri]|uniref:uncharacterized protein n=1 Tax=Diaporthe citri TaxID=83186 RepID=UPI001C81E262|nr:uncharacterized protein INS49_010046 [Diaporthe citri]KAG6361817.1 hypothetical protein INS49_010046 [Diaporthe citri]